ncbi:MAG: YdbL family protein [bacterium]
MQMKLRHFLLGLAITIVGFLGMANAASPVIEEAKAQCIIGEQVNGYLGVVTGKQVSVDQAREMRSVNQKRKAFYADLAEKNGVTVEITAQLTAEKLIATAKSGQCVQDANGSWLQKP